MKSTIDNRQLPIRLLVREGARRLRAAGIERPEKEAEWLLAERLRCKPAELYLREPALSEQALEQFRADIEARAAGRPLQYILGETEFCGARLALAPGVFIPRPETESVVEAALIALRQRAQELGRPLRILDLGTGSGCIAIALARGLAACVLVGVEVSWESLRIARDNLRRHDLESTVALVQGRWADAIKGPVDAIVSNPPYVPSRAVNRLPLDVRQEPRAALDGGQDGLRDLRHLMDEGPRLLAVGGLMVLECAEDHVHQLVQRGRSASWIERIDSVVDLAGRPRGVVIRRV